MGKAEGWCYGTHIPLWNMKEKQVDGQSFGGGMDIFKKNIKKV